MAAASYSEEYYLTRESWRDWRIEAKALVSVARLDKQARVLEVGCGGGGLLKILDQEGMQPTGVDTQATALQIARHRSDLSDRTNVVQIAADEPLPFAANVFHAILGQHVIEHITGVDNALSEWKRILRPGGRLALATPNALYPDPSHFHDDEHVNVFTPDELRACIERAGFVVDSIATMFPYLTRARAPQALAVRAFRLFQRLPYFAWRGRTVIVGACVAK